MSDTDAVYIRYLEPSPMLASVSEWPIIKAINEMGEDIVDSNIVAQHLNAALPARDQPAFAHVQKMVIECAELLDVEPPHLFVKQDPNLNAYVTRLQEPHLLVLTSGFYELYKDRPEEMRFVIGHELGHLKCDHIRCHMVGRHLLNAIYSGASEVTRIPKDVLAPLLVIQLLHWYRASEVSADRAGLICVGGNVEASEQALLRLLHGTSETIDATIAREEFLTLQQEPFVKIVRRLQSLGVQHPFIPERVAALRRWSNSAGYAALLERKDGVDSEWSLNIRQVSVSGLPQTDVGFGRNCDPLLRVAVGGSLFEGKTIDNVSLAIWTQLSWRTSYIPNGILIVEVLDSDSGKDDHVGTCVFRVRKPETTTLTGMLRSDECCLGGPKDVGRVRVAVEFAKSGRK